jgi:hypothetical protein
MFMMYFSQNFLTNMFRLLLRQVQGDIIVRTQKYKCGYLYRHSMTKIIVISVKIISVI